MKKSKASNSRLLPSEVGVGKRVHSCHRCGKSFYWNKDSRTWGSLLTDEEGITVVLCSDKCADEIKPMLADAPRVNVRYNRASKSEAWLQWREGLLRRGPE